MDEDPLHKLDPLAQGKLGDLTTRRTRPLCQECGKDFACGDSLKSHMAIHRERQSYRCNWPGCGKRFLCLSSVKRHKVTIPRVSDNIVKLL